MNVGKFVAGIKLNQAVKIAGITNFISKCIERLHEIFILGRISERCRRQFIRADVRIQCVPFFRKRRVFVSDANDGLVAAFENFLRYRNESFNTVHSKIDELADVVSVVVSDF